jgi:hypothetical protein
MSTQTHIVVLNVGDQVLSKLLHEAIAPYFDIGQQEELADFIISDKEGSGSSLYIFDSKGQEISSVDQPVRAGRVVDILSTYSLAGLNLGTLPEQINFSHYSLDIHSALITSEDNKSNADSAVRLTEKERDILCYLYQKENNEAQRDELLDTIWGYAEGIETHTLETHIYRLRKKIENNPAEPEILITDGSSYKLVI